mmetsp:Transcript_27477/g.67828  ORF Transcript_27477/g.67828 Transcript_27477/m.67828 type:complete len:337 (-) Transcript_27477:1022-2032(-)
MGASTGFIAFLIVSHMTVSSTMLVLNKAVLAEMPFATIVLLAQVGSSAVILWVLGKLKFLDVDPLELATMKAFFWNAFAFMALIYTNAKALESANVEAVVAFRTMSIFVTAYGDFRLLQARALDSKSIGALLMVILGAVGYCLMDKGFKIENMMWVFAYGVCNAAYPIVTQLVIRSKSMTSWGRTYYNNILTFLIFLPMVFIIGEDRGMMDQVDKGMITVWASVLLLMSCVWGTAISFLGFLVLENVSATTFNVMGNSNKILTLVVNGLLWDKHASLQANMCLLVSLVGAALYAEARRRQANAEKAAAKSGYDDEEEGKEMLPKESDDDGKNMQAK